MKFSFVMPIAMAVGVACSCPANSLKLEGLPFHTNVPVIWKATNALPQGITIYKAATESFSQAAVSNAMAVGSFKAINRIKSQDQSMLRFQDHRDKMEMTKYLEVSPSQGWMKYYDQTASGVQTRIRGVPSAERTEQLAMDLLRRLGADTNQVVARRSPPSEGTVTSIDRKTGQQIDKAVYMRSVTFTRQLDGIELLGSSFSVDYCNDEKPSMVGLAWKTLQPSRRCKTAAQTTILDWIKAGKAVIPIPTSVVPPQFPPDHAKSFTIANMRLFYINYPDENKNDCYYPYAQFTVTADVGNTGNPSFLLECPIFEESGL